MDLVKIQQLATYIVGLGLVVYGVVGGNDAATTIGLGLIGGAGLTQGAVAIQSKQETKQILSLPEDQIREIFQFEADKAVAKK